VHQGSFACSFAPVGAVEECARVGTRADECGGPKIVVGHGAEDELAAAAAAAVDVRGTRWSSARRPLLSVATAVPRSLEDSKREGRSDPDQRPVQSEREYRRNDRVEWMVAPERSGRDKV
jgi:hypothetical protein